MHLRYRSSNKFVRIGQGTENGKFVHAFPISLGLLNIARVYKRCMVIIFNINFHQTYKH